MSDIEMSSSFDFSGDIPTGQYDIARALEAIAPQLKRIADALEAQQPSPDGGHAQLHYSHRNGETEAPTIDGIYWFSGLMRFGRKVRPQILVATIFVSPTTQKLHFADYFVPIENVVNGQWWGPLTPPWDSQRPQPPGA